MCAAVLWVEAGQSPSVSLTPLVTGLLLASFPFLAVSGAYESLRKARDVCTASGFQDSPSFTFSRHCGQFLSSCLSICYERCLSSMSFLL